MKSILAHHGVPESLTPDNGTRHPQGNGPAERAVRTLKTLLKKTVCSSTSTPPENGFSPSELLMDELPFQLSQNSCY